MTSRQHAVQRAKSTPSSRGKQPQILTVDKMTYLEYRDMRLEDPYAIRRNPRITDQRFYNKWQVDIYNSVYQTYKDPGVIMHSTIELDKMKKDLKYFGEALAMCEEFDLVKLMAINKPFDPELIKQFFTTVQIGRAHV